MEAVIGEIAETEKLAGELDELKKLSALVTSSNVNAETKANARSNWDLLCNTIRMSTSGTPSRSRYGTMKGNGALSEKSQMDQSGEAANRRQMINFQLQTEARLLKAKRQ